MAVIPANLNGVVVEFKSQVNNSVDQRIVDSLKTVIQPNISAAHSLSKIFVSSANDQHEAPSRHVSGQGKAVDISRINGKKMSVYYPSDSAVKSIVEAIQTAFEDCTHRRENFGPYIKKKHGKAWSVGGHADHIHLSVD